MNRFMEGSTPGRSRSGPDDELTSTLRRTSAGPASCSTVFLASPLAAGSSSWAATAVLPVGDNPTPRRSLRTMRFTTSICAATLLLAGCGGGQSDQSQKIGSEIGGTCTATPYAIIGKLDHTKTPIYDCTKGTKRMCVTEQNGIASDQTEVVRLLFQNSLSGGKPGCLTG